MKGLSPFLLSITLTQQSSMTKKKPKVVKKTAKKAAKKNGKKLPGGDFSTAVDRFAVGGSKRTVNKAVKKVAKKAAKKTTKKAATARTGSGSDGQLPVKSKRTEKFSGLRTRTPHLRLAYAIGEKVYLKPGRVYTTVTRIYLGDDQIKYHCATGAPATADQMELASEHKRRGIDK